MKFDEAFEFAEAWVSAWNRRDVEAVLAYFAEDAEFASPKAQKFVGRPVLRNKAELRDYWKTALEQVQEIRFSLDSVFIGPNERQVLVLYFSEINGQVNRAAEIFWFDEDGLVARGEALYGVTQE